jgi:hypothetical protein
MSILRNYRLLIIGFLLVFGGVAVPFLTMAKVLQPSFLLLFASYTGSVVGVILAIIWSAGYMREYRNRDN